MKWFRFAIVVALLGTLTIQAEPIKTWSWIAPTQFENDELIPYGDLDSYTLHCSTTPGGPYTASKVFNYQTSPSDEDMAFIVNGMPGTYYCVSTVHSISHDTTSGYSNEVNFLVASGALSFVPRPPVLMIN